ncbi:ribosome biogenesis regulatory protein-domain-containing protein [Pisolithus orientalis]|uniref:ribosome biogenesis regulatory protein-domain-containing protein n=1 Tax=Pisolithus orientalis TaxID=936130 RepID=UPI0022252F58|nr:ribosome biogenesis regulatory protein-domain-containing protein [Pisolithus orientalis]KAI6034841.1 ribosome biogenesis regulatory protein-domain-containing protein [Pisolithus orientalis]
MDVSNLLAAQASKFQSVTVEKDTPLDVDAGFLTVTDHNPIDEDSYRSNLEEYLKSTARDGIQALVAALYALPTESSVDGSFAKLPPPTTQLPRAKPLPKPKPLTKWEKFAAVKGIQKKRRDKKVWDEQKQEWVNRWGRGGKNKEKEDQWIHEVKANADVDFDPAQEARNERKSRVAKNERQRLQNLARAQAAQSEREQRKEELEKTLAATRTSTASMGKFDKKLEGDKKIRGVKRKFDPTEVSAEKEKQASLAVLSQLDGDAKRAKIEKGTGDDVVNVRKAIRAVSKGKGGVALGREVSKRSKDSGKSKRGKR